MKRVALVGSGSIADQHLGALLEIPTAKIVGVYSRGEDKARKAAEKANCDATTDWKGLVRRSDVDVVDIVTSSGSHAEIALAAIEAGKHVLSEKPLAMTASDAKLVVDAAKAKGVTLGVVSQRRFEAQHVAVKKALSDGALGKLLLVEVSCPYYRTQAYYDSADWRGKIATDGGALMNQSIHSVDLMLWLAGPAATVTGRIATQTHRIEVEDLALGIVTFKNGAFGSIMASTSIQPGFQPCLNLYGEKGTIKLEGSSIAHWTVPGVAAPATASAASAGIATPKLAGHEAHKAQILDFLGAVEEKRRPSVSGEDGRDAVAFVEAVYASKGAPVTL